ncbi:MAG: circularly permuted type 2 ATP-grasp protein [Candidatus Acidiferrales bacterium]
MKISPDAAKGPLLSEGYPQTAGLYDEMFAAPGVLRPHWDTFINALSARGADELARRWQTARQRIRENGVTYNVYGDPLGMARPWNLDAIPLMILPAEWSQLEAGLIQRARLLNLILADLYGPQQLLRGGQIPPALVFANPGFWRPCHGIKVSGNTYLHLLAVDLARGPSGEWWVISDRTQAPSGAGYSLENRIVMAETFPDLFRKFRVKRLASFFRVVRETLLKLSPTKRENPRVVLLTPGPFNETYFEHSYLARYLGFTLVQGGDLTVRDGRVYLKTLEGLKQVDVILRRVDDSFCDPVELRSDSYLGVAGLVEAVRAGNVAVANALGSGLIETSAFMPFFPGLSRRMLGEDLKLPSAATWWCGQPDALRYVLDNLDFLVIKPAFPSKGMEPVFGGKLGPEQRARLVARIKESPHEFAGQELLNLSAAPVWSEEYGLTPRRVVLRVYLAASGDSWVVIPGGLARVSPSIDTPVVSMQRGGGSKDTWVLSEKPVGTFSLQRPRDVPVELNRGAVGDLPSRAADHIFWLGRYAERSEHLARMLRCILIRLTRQVGSTEAEGPDWESLMKMYECLESPHSRLSKDDPEGHPDKLRDMEGEILSRIFEEQRSDSLTATLNRAGRSAAQVRDRLSSDLLRVVNQFSTLARGADDSAWGYVSIGDALAVLNECIGTLAALRGIEMENIVRGPGWHFLSIGRRIERSIQLVELFRTIIVPLSPRTWPALDMLLEVADSSMAYRSRYFTTLQPAPVLDLLMNEELNPRALAFQINDLIEHCRSLSGMPSGAGWPILKQQRLEIAAANLFAADVRALCEPGPGRIRERLDELLAQVDAALPALSNAITHAYFSHAEQEQTA